MRIVDGPRPSRAIHCSNCTLSSYTRTGFTLNHKLKEVVILVWFEVDVIVAVWRFSLHYQALG